MSWDAGMQIEAIEAASQGDVSKVRRLVGCAANLDPAAAFILSCSELGAGNFAQARAALDELDRLAPTAPEAKLLDRLIVYRDGRPNAGWLSGLLANQGGLGLHIDASPLAQTKATPRWAQTHGPVRDEVAKFVADALGGGMLRADVLEVARSVPERIGAWRDGSVRRVALAALEEASYGSTTSTPDSDAAVRLLEELAANDPTDLGIQCAVFEARAASAPLDTLGALESVIGRDRLLLDRSRIYDLWKAKLDGEVAPSDVRPLAAAVAWLNSSREAIRCEEAVGDARLRTRGTEAVKRVARLTVMLSEQELAGPMVQDRRDGWADLCTARKLAPDVSLASLPANLKDDVVLLSVGEQDLEWLLSVPIRPLRDELFDADMTNEVELVRRLVAPGSVFEVTEQERELWGSVFGLSSNPPPSLRRIVDVVHPASQPLDQKTR